MTANQPILSNLQKELLKLYANGVSDNQLLIYLALRNLPLDGYLIVLYKGKIILKF